MPSLMEIKESEPSRQSQARCPSARTRRPDYADLRKRQPGEPPVSGRPSAAPESASLVARINEAVASDEESGIELIYTEVDQLLRGEAFSAVDELLNGVEVASYSVVVLLAFISITYAARDRLNEWAGFFTRARARIAELEPERVEELLSGFE